tara:strand:+ start:60 stop:290 length:231 start_codon:yes stop_codon:yes gene_type:complete
MEKNYKESYEFMESLFLNEKKISNKQKSKIYWFEAFEEYIKENNIDIYTNAIKHTNKLEKNLYFTDEEIKKKKLTL